MRVVLPGRGPDTAFGDNARARMTDGFPQPYAEMVRGVLKGWEQETGPVTRSIDVALAVWRAVTDLSCPAELPAGADALAWAGR